MNEADKIIRNAHAASIQSAIDDSNARVILHKQESAPLHDKLRALFTNPDHAVEYDAVCSAFGHEPTLSELGFHLSSMTLTPEEAMRVDTLIAGMASDVFRFNCSEGGDQPEDVIDALYGF